MVKVPISFNDLKTKAHDLDVGKFETVPMGLKNLSDVVDKKVVKNKKFDTLNTKVNNLNKKIPDASTLLQTTQYNTDKQNLEKEIRDAENNTTNISGF